MILRKLHRLGKIIWDNLDLTFLLSASVYFGIRSYIGMIPDPTAISALILIALGLLAISMLRIRTHFDKTVEKINRADVFETQEEMYAVLENYIEDHRVRRATLIQYSGQRVNRIVRKLVSQGADVTLFVQSEDTAQKYSNAQVPRIKEFPEFIKTEFNEAFKKEKSRGTLELCVYDPPASLRAINIYKYVDEDEKQMYPDDDIKLLGHNQPGKLLYYGGREFDVMNDLFEHLVENFNGHIDANAKKRIY